MMQRNKGLVYTKQGFTVNDKIVIKALRLNGDDVSYILEPRYQVGKVPGRFSSVAGLAVVLVDVLLIIITLPCELHAHAAALHGVTSQRHIRPGIGTAALFSLFSFHF